MWFVFLKKKNILIFLFVFHFETSAFGSIYSFKYMIFTKSFTYHTMKEAKCNYIATFLMEYKSYEALTYCKRKFVMHNRFYFLLCTYKKVLVSLKFLTFCFWCIHTFFDALNTIWLFLENVCLCVTVKNFLASTSRELIKRISWNFSFKLMSLINRRCSSIFSGIIGISWSLFLRVKLKKKIIQNLYH